MNNQLRAQKPAYLQITEVMEAVGCHQSALENEALSHSKLFRLNNYGEFRHIETGQTIQEWAKSIPAEKPHWLEGYVAPELTAQDEARQIIRAVSDTPNTKTVNALFAYFKHEPGKAEQVLKAAGIDLRKVNAKGEYQSTRKLELTGEEEITATPKQTDAERKSNPFSVAGWNVTKQGSLIKAVGFEKAAQIAATVGVRIGDSRPNPNYK
jgi:hypothetical protein